MFRPLPHFLSWVSRRVCPLRRVSLHLRKNKTLITLNTFSNDWEITFISNTDLIHTHLQAHLSVFLSTCLSLCPSTLHLPLHLSVYLYSSPPVSLLIPLPVFLYLWFSLSLFKSVCLSVFIQLCLSVHLSVCLYFFSSVCVWDGEFVSQVPRCRLSGFATLCKQVKIKTIFEVPRVCEFS